MTGQSKTPAPDFLTEEEKALEADAAEWRTVSEEEHDETKFTFENWGDEFIGIYDGPRRVENENGKFTQYLFHVDNLHYFINGNWSLGNAMQNVPKGARCRIRYVADKDTGQESAMKLYKVDVARRRVTASSNT